MKPVAFAARYARALAELAGEKDAQKLEPLAAELDLAARVLGADPRLTGYLSAPSVERSQKDALLSSFARQAKVSDLTQKFLGVLLDNGRIGALPDIAAAFAALKDEAAGIVPAETTVAVRLSAADESALRTALEKMTGRQVRLKVTVDPQVLGGARTRIGSRVYDGTLRTRLTALRRLLAQAGQRG